MAITSSSYDHNPTPDELMSATITLTMSQTSGIEAACPNCGLALPHNSSEYALDAQKQIEELQAQVRLLTEKATAAGRLPL